MEISDALDFLRTNHRGVLITRGPGGRVQSSPVVAGVDEDGRIAISSRETAYKVKNLLRDPQASYCGFPDGFFGSWVQVDGSVEVVHLPEAMERLVDLYRSLAGEHPDWDEYRSAMVREQRVVIRLAVERAGPSKSG
jgi:PPOX class probable F420-dependent enzyme